MRVWHVTRSLHGGAGRYAYRLSEALRGSGVDSCVLTADECPGVEGSQMGIEPLSPTSGWLRGLTSRIILSLSHRLTSAPYHSLLEPRMYAGESMPRPGDIIHLHGLTGWMGLKALNTLIPHGCPVFWTIHDLWPMTGGCIIYAGCKGFCSDCSACPVLYTGWKGWAKIELEMKKQFIRETNIHPIANSSWTAELISDAQAFENTGSVPIIPPIIDPAYFEPNIRDVREKLQIAYDKAVLTLVARSVTDQHKGIPAFLEALAARRELAEKCVVLLLGDGKLPIPDNLDVRTLGWIDSDSKLAQLYFTSDVFVSPSSMETFGMALAEAQACGTPVIAFDVGGIKDAVSSECMDFLVPNGDMAALLEGLKYVLQRNSDQTKRLRVDRNWARQRFDAEAVAQRQKDVYLSAPEVEGLN